MMFEIARSMPDRNDLVAALSNANAGALATFEGWVRNKNEGRSVLALEYECYESLAKKEGEKVVAEAVARYGLLDAACIHRVGKLNVGEVAVWVGVVAGHRGEAFEACRYVIDEIKKRLPIWKKEFYADGTTEWVNCAHHEQHRASDSAVAKSESAHADAFGKAFKRAHVEVSGIAHKNACGDDAHERSNTVREGSQHHKDEQDDGEFELHWGVLKSRSPRELVYVDIRPEAERESDETTKKLLAGRNVLQWPLAGIETGTLHLDPKLTYLFLCQSGKDSGKLVKKLRAGKHKNVFSLAEGVKGMAVAKDSIRV